nr:leucine-rich repeat extensin-like protein 2 [Penaeus vannamei]
MITLSIKPLYLLNGQAPQDGNHLGKAKIGQTCTTRYDCQSGPGLLTSEVCIDGFCTCSSTARLRLDEYSFAPECDSLLHETSMNCSDSHSSALEECPPNSKCRGGEGCRCNDGFEFVGTDCIKVVYQKVLERCHFYENGFLFSSTFLPNITSGKCIPEADFLRANDLAKYIALHGEYCQSSSHCLEGLECRNYECSCPSPCTYKKDLQACDCGEFVVSSTGPIVVGILGGLLIIIFWTWRIRTTWRRHAKKQASQNDAHAPPSVQRGAPSYPLAPVTSVVPAGSLLSQKEEGLGITPDQIDIGKIPESYPLLPPAQPIGFQIPASSQDFLSNTYDDVFLPDVSAPPAEALRGPSAPILPPPPYTATSYNQPYAPSFSPPYPHPDMASHPPSSLPPSYPPQYMPPPNPPTSMPPSYPSASSSTPYPLNP